MTDSFNETKRELYELMQRSRRERFTPPTPEGRDAVRGAHDDDGQRSSTYVRGRQAGSRRGADAHDAERVVPDVQDPRGEGPHRAAPRKRRLPRRVGKPHRRGERFAAEGRRLRDEHMDAVMEHVGIEDMRHLVRILRKVVEFHELDPEATCKSRAEGDEAPCA